MQAGYIEFVEGGKHAAKNADIADTHDVFTDAGYLLTENDLIIDLDNIEKSVIEKIISMFNVKTQIVWTNRGAHFYFKKPKGFKGSKKVCPLGFEVEYKHVKNTPHGVCIKQDGKMRTIQNEGFREDLPDIFFINRKLESLLGMDEDEGRNQALFQHRMKIHNLNQWQSIMRFINNHILATSLDEKEFQNIIRDKGNIGTTSNDPFEIAQDLIKRLKVHKFGGNLYTNDDQKFVSINDDDFIPIVTREVLGKPTRFIDEIIKQMKYQLFNKRTPENGWDIKLQNGILRNGEFYEVDYQEFTPYFINLNYDENAKPVPVVDEYLDFLTDGDKLYRDFILESLAHILITDPGFKRMLAKFFIFVGEGGNGKGTLLTVIRKIIGTENCSSLSIEDMTKEQYFFSMQGKLVNLGDDIHDTPINHKQMKQLKNISTCDFLAIRQLFKQSLDVVMTTTLIFTSNHLLKSFEKSEAYKRRVDWCPMYGVPTKKDPKFIAKLTTKEALEYWLRLIIEAYKRLYKNCTFTECQKLQEFNEDYHETNNNSLTYIRSFTKDSFINFRPREVYDKYKIWAEDNYGEGSAQSSRVFQETLKKEFDLVVEVKRVSNLPTRVYAIKEEARKKKKEEKQWKK
ncbi:phage/plasmid primase, P4 family [Brevibacillus laterosporus]|uniref:DNA primase family protein n=1 Tax=Brevibacillus laterosporus TaxID=1465 RepID=UPI00215D3AFA|nr:phage/plasmid primase, P4 family [Brevibacillus laterosporus]MCR8995957.1 phage/plasmid primase, P4 family [Brevibacillus laterosporus]